jgi:hypothetical protein
MHNIHRLRFAHGVGVLLLFGCREDSLPTRATSGVVPAAAAAHFSIADAAARVRSDAASGIRRRGEQDEMLRIEGQVPGFAGFYLDSVGDVVVYMKAVPGTVATAIRPVLAARYAARSEVDVRQAMARAGAAKIVDAKFALSELVAMQNRVTEQPILVRGFVGVGAYIAKNRLAVGFADTADVPAGIETLVSIGIPREAILAETWGPITTTGTFTDVTRPVGAGVAIVTARPDVPGWFEFGSAGFIVRDASGTNRLLVSAHVFNSHPGINGVTGDTIFQIDRVRGGGIGTVAVNPLWQATGCPTNNPATGLPPDYCTDADVAIGNFNPLVASQRKVATSDQEGLNGDTGSQHINNFYPITATMPPELIVTGRNVVHKSGYRTGTTTGAVAVPCVDAFATMPWRSQKPPVLKWLMVHCVYQVRHAGWGEGDSGGPVFARQDAGGPYFAMGIVSSGAGTISGGICNAGAGCSFFFTPWSQIESWLGVGSLNPTRTP